MTPNPFIFAPLLIASLAVFSWGCWKRLSLISLGQPEDRFDNIGTRFGDRRARNDVRFLFGFFFFFEYVWSMALFINGKYDIE